MNINIYDKLLDPLSDYENLIRINYRFKKAMDKKGTYLNYEDNIYIDDKDKCPNTETFYNKLYRVLNNVYGFDSKVVVGNSLDFFNNRLVNELESEDFKIKDEKIYLNSNLFSLDVKDFDQFKYSLGVNIDSKRVEEFLDFFIRKALLRDINFSLSYYPYKVTGNTININLDLDDLLLYLDLIEEVKEEKDFDTNDIDDLVHPRVSSYVTFRENDEKIDYHKFFQYSFASTISDFLLENPDKTIKGKKDTAINYLKKLNLKYFGENNVDKGTYKVLDAVSNYKEKIDYDDNLNYDLKIDLESYPYYSELLNNINKLQEYYMNDSRFLMVLEKKTRILASDNYFIQKELNDILDDFYFKQSVYDTMDNPEEFLRGFRSRLFEKLEYPDPEKFGISKKAGEDIRKYDEMNNKKMRVRK